MFLLTTFKKVNKISVEPSKRASYALRIEVTLKIQISLLLNPRSLISSSLDV